MERNVSMINSLSRFARDRRGNVLITFALAITTLLGAAGLGSEVASWYSAKRDMQNAADLGAASGVMVLKTYYTGSPTTTTDNYAKSEAKTAATLHGFTDSVNNTSVYTYVRPNSGPYSSASYDHKAIEVIVQRPAPLLFSGLFMSSGPTIAARAVAVVSTSYTDCMFARNPTAARALYLQGNAAINDPDCGAEVASTSPSAVDITGGASSVTLRSLEVGGGITGSMSTFGSTPVSTNVQNLTDPYSTRNIPTLGTGYPTGTSWPGNHLTSVTPTQIYTPPGGNITTSMTTANMFPGANCDLGCVINGSIGTGTNGNNQLSGTINLSHGVYFVTGNISMGSGSSLVTNGATIVLTNSVAGNIGTFTMHSNPTVTMLAPSNQNPNDPGYAATQNFPGLAGIAMVQDARASEATLNGNGSNVCDTVNCNTFQGTTTSSVNGAFYFPMGNLHWQGNAITTNCFQIIADSLILEGNPGINVNNCTQGEARFGPLTVMLAE
jgi:Flp pilus assembly protein TadG